MNVLIAYYSRTGYTRRVAELLAARLGATPLRITERRSRLGFFGYHRCLVEAVLGLDADIDTSAVDPAAFDLVLLGTPIWGWHLSSPVRSFARRHAAQIRRCAFFCTMGGSGSARAFVELERCVGQAPVATLALTDGEVDGTSLTHKIDDFVSALRQPGQAASPRQVASGPVQHSGT